MHPNEVSPLTLNEYVDSVKEKRIAVVGAGVSNMPLIRLLLENGCDVTVCDKRSLDEMGDKGVELKALGASLKLGEDYLEGLDHDLIFRTPGLMPFDPHLLAAAEKGSEITSEMEVFFALCPCRKIAVTGSDGKTTTTTVISELLKASGHTVHLGGNIGRPLLCDVPLMRPADFAVLELSSFQLHSMSCRPDVAVITNISPNHLDKHKDYQDYIDAKKTIFTAQTAEDRLVLNLDDGHSAYYAAAARSRISYFSDKSRVENGAYCLDGVLYRVQDGRARRIMEAAEIRIPGEHNVQNYLAAFSATEGLVPDEVCHSVAACFAGVEHRLEQVREIKGVLFINDSIASSPSRTAAGLRALKRKPIIIVGGYDKHIAFDGLGDDLCRYARRVFITGATAGKIRSAIEASPLYPESKLPFEVIDGFDDAVRAAAASAESGDIVILSPACASFDAFPNFAARGNHFKKMVMELRDEDIGY
ncbi:MAG: UDP-N-acetylmuramoyl-L-alanine--D-glutamate ligase [Oscillospiraceae bacterium]|nr:UDP-N-acetylmuramoyl-L-alanine--D-glutamate ligase [Oscillospiraceae bacterium]